MGLLNRIKTTLFSRDEARRRAEDEAAFHLEMSERNYLDRGHTPAEAARLARASYGNVLRMQEQAGDTDILGGLEGTLRDLHVAYRRLSRSPLFLASSVLLLAVGLGVNAAVFSVLDALFLRGLPYPAADRLVVVEEIRNGKPSNSNPVRLADWRTRVTAFENVASTYGETVQLREREGNRTVSVLRLAGDWVSLLGVRIQEGRGFTSEELRGGKVALLTAGNRNLGRPGDTVRLGPESYTLIGIVDNAVAPGENVQFVIPIEASMLEGNRKAGYLTGVARLRSGVSIAAAEAEIASVAAQLGKEYPDTDRGTQVRLIGAQQAWSAEARQPALYVQAASALLLLITLVNLAGLLAARALERKREDTVRLFLGAGRWHLVRLHLAESGLLVALGCLAALVVAPWVLRLIQLSYGADFAPVMTAVIDLRVGVFLLLAGCCSTLLFAGIMAWQTARESDVRGQSQFQLRNLLIIVEAALGLVLLAVSFQLVDDFAQLRFAPLGFREQGLVSARLYLSWTSEAKDLRAAIDQGKQRIAALPGVTAVAVVDRLPLEGGSQDSPLQIEGKAEKTTESIGIRMASTNYFALMGIRLLAGQLPTDDTAIVVNETFSRRYLDNNPIGRNLSTDGQTWRRVAGVVADVRASTRDAVARPEIFLSDRIQFWPLLTFVIQTSQPASNLAQPLRSLFTEIASEGDFRGVLPLESRIDEIVAQPRRQRDVVAVFGVGSLVLVIAGVYGVMSSEMLRRRREMGIRIAIGASRAHIVGIAAMRAFWLSTAAVVVGGLVPLLLLDSWIDPKSILAAAFAVTAGMLLAALVPAWRSACTDPVLALRQD